MSEYSLACKLVSAQPRGGWGLGCRVSTVELAVVRVAATKIAAATTSKISPVINKCLDESLGAANLADMGICFFLTTTYHHNAAAAEKATTLFIKQKLQRGSCIGGKNLICPRNRPSLKWHQKGWILVSP